ncbi:helix-turn-helix domain-containing protein [Micromonospora lupini]|uniref:winged helix-turn-helix transcriptional regulator n=1 Tax=Micromonospora lupini TaxID=285679 RepID=UPI0033E8FEE6
MRNVVTWPPPHGGAGSRNDLARGREPVSVGRRIVVLAVDDEQPIPRGTVAPISVSTGRGVPMSSYRSSSPDCPTRLAVEIIAEKWAVVVLFALSLEPQRPSDLAELIGGISRKVLTQTLRRLQAYGLVERYAYAEAPPRVEYSPTKLGGTLVEPIKILTDWARDNGEAIVDFQETRLIPSSGSMPYREALSRWPTNNS